MKPNSLIQKRLILPILMIGGLSACASAVSYKDQFCEGSLSQYRCEGSISHVSGKQTLYLGSDDPDGYIYLSGQYQIQLYVEVGQGTVQATIPDQPIPVTVTAGQPSQLQATVVPFAGQVEVHFKSQGGAVEELTY